MSEAKEMDREKGIEWMIGEIAEARATRDEIGKDIKCVQKALAKHPEYQAREALRERKRTLRAFERSTRAKLDELILEAYAETDDKHPHPATTVAVYTVLDITDEDQVKKDIEERGMMGLFEINTDKLKKVLGAGIEVKGAQLKPDPRVRLSGDLSEYTWPLAEEEE